MPDKVLEDVGNVVRQIAEDESKIRAGFEWKKYLSGALSDEQIYLAMFVLSVFYFVYTLYNACIDSNAKDEGDIIRNCTCRENHRNFYLSWTIICFTLWLILHSSFTLVKEFPAGARLRKKIIQISNLLGDCMIFKNKDEEDSSSEGSSAEKLKNLTDRHIGQCESFLWSRSYEAYAIGRKKKNEHLNLKEIEKLIVTSLSPETCKKRLGKKESKNLQDSTDNADQNVSEKFHFVKGMSLALFHLFLVIVRFIVQLLVVPLLMVQMFDTYTLLCLAERDYCNRISQFRLHLDQTALSFSFYCSLMISLLVTTWLNLVPLPKLEYISIWKLCSKVTDETK